MCPGARRAPYAMSPRLLVHHPIHNEYLRPIAILGPPGSPPRAEPGRTRGRAIRRRRSPCVRANRRRAGDTASRGPIASGPARDRPGGAAPACTRSRNPRPWRPVGVSLILPGREPPLLDGPQLARPGRARSRGRCNSSACARPASPGPSSRPGDSLRNGRPEEDIMGDQAVRKARDLVSEVGEQDEPPPAIADVDPDVLDPARGRQRAAGQPALDVFEYAPRGLGAGWARPNTA